MQIVLYYYWVGVDSIVVDVATGQKLQSIHEQCGSAMTTWTSWAEAKEFMSTHS
jgi:hypothetical protein